MSTDKSTPRPFVTRRVKPFKATDEIIVRKMVSYLESALICAKMVTAPRTAARIRKALSSARGAVRNVEYRRIYAQSILPREHAQ